MPRTTSRGRSRAPVPGDSTASRRDPSRTRSKAQSRAGRPSQETRGRHRASEPDETGEPRAPRAFWKGSLSFGLIEIPALLRPAVQSDELHFTLLDKHDFTPVGYRRYNKATGKEVAWDDIVRGYEYDKDEFVVLTDEDLKRANVEATGTIEILDFVDRDQVDPVYFDTTYYVEPIKKNSKSYLLLRDALARANKVAIARVVLRTRQHLAALIVRDDVLMLDLLRYAHEIRAASRIAGPAAGKQGGVTERELQMAERLIQDMTTGWDPKRYRDEYRDDLMALVDKRVREGKTRVIESAPAEAPSRPAREVMDLMPLLKRSLEDRGGARRGDRKPARKAPDRRKQRSA